MADEIYALDPESVRLLLRARVGSGDVIRTDTEDAEHTPAMYLELSSRHPLDNDDRKTETFMMNRGQAEVLLRELALALAQ